MFLIITTERSTGAVLGVAYGSKDDKNQAISDVIDIASDVGFLERRGWTADELAEGLEKVGYYEDGNVRVTLHELDE